MTFFRRKRALAGGLTIAGSSLGGVIFPLMVVRLIPKIGFPWTMRVCAFMIFGLLLITNVTISSNLDHHPRPFKIAQYLGPLRETNYVLMCFCSFFFYCMSNSLHLIASILTIKGECSYPSTISFPPASTTACLQAWPLI